MTATITPLPLPPPPTSESPCIAIVGGGIVGLTTALCLKQHIMLHTSHNNNIDNPRIPPLAPLRIVILEQAHAFVQDVGAGMGLYPNGLRVLRDLGLLPAIRAASQPLQGRRWERAHDGSTVAEAPESVLYSRQGDENDHDSDQKPNENQPPLKQPQLDDNNDSDDDTMLQSVGIRRWRLQKILYEAVQKAGIAVQFGKKTVQVESHCKQQQQHQVRLVFADGTDFVADMVIAADGSRSTVRTCLLERQHREQPQLPQHRLEYTGTTCLMGISKIPTQGIALPAALDGGTHGVFFPTGPDEQCFQFHCPVPAHKADPGNWGQLSQAVTARQCQELVQQLSEQGWNDKYLEPFRHVVSAVRVGFCTLEPPLSHFVFDHQRIVLVGDAAHPPVPYLGQGAQMGLEDAGVLSLLMQNYCVDKDGYFSLSNISTALKLYEQQRIPRTRQNLDRAQQAGRSQAMRAGGRQYRKLAKEEHIQRDVFFHKTLPLLFPGAQYDYQQVVAAIVEQNPKHMSCLSEQDETDSEAREESPSPMNPQAILT